MAAMTRPWRLDALATLAGETEDRLRQYADAGLLHRRRDGDLEPDSLHRLRLVQFAHSRGIDDARLAAAIAAQGDLLRIFEEIDPLRDTTANLVDAARQLGLDDALITHLADLLEWGDPANGTESDVAALGTLARALQLGMPRDALLQVVRVFVDATDRLADGVVRTFHDYVHERFRADGFGGAELVEATQGVGRPLLDLVEPSVVYFLRRAYRRANREDMLRHLTEDTNPPPSTPGVEHATVLFVDLASFTPLTETMGDHTAADLLGRFSAIVRSTTNQYRGRIVKQIGDAFMVVFAQPRDAVEFGLAMDRFVSDEPQFPALHLGAHQGSLLYRDGDYVGGTVNLAARVASAGAAGQFLITQELRAAAGELADGDFVELPPRRLKGIAEPMRLIQVRRRDPDRSQRETDPECGLLLRPDDVATRTTWNGKTFAFCCQMCEQAFTDNPARFSAA
jgi:class 3 adenylate cyclase